ncbi:MAG: Lipoprotein NlpI precursor [Planctomycetota bacterium]
MWFIRLVLMWGLCPGLLLAQTDDETVLQIERLNAEQIERYQEELKSLPTPDPQSRASVDVYSHLGDAELFLGHAARAEEHYRQMVVLDPSLDASHWRLGIACYLADHPQAGAAQFEKYHSFDSVDRENGIWRYFCHYRASGKKAAREQLLRYEKDDRPPFREVYQLFQGTLSAEQVLKAADGGDEGNRASRQFYSHLYVGLNASLEGDNATAVRSLQQATLNTWPRTAGYGPRYMWQVGRLELNRLQKSGTR